MQTVKSISCDACGTRIQPEDVYRYQDRQLCAYCCMDTRMPRVRKHHWQYLRSIKTEYLQPAKKK